MEKKKQFLINAAYGVLNWNLKLWGSKWDSIRW